MRLFEIIKEDPIKIGGKKNENVDEFMKTYFKVTQVHPFDNQARIAWDGKATATVVPFNDHVNLSAVQTLAPGERSGSPNGMVMTLVQISQETGVPIRLTAKPFGDMKGRLTKPQLKAWYKRRGFVIDRGDEMIFDPKIHESLQEEAPPGMEGWIKKRKPGFKKRYGKDWEKVLYATAWKQHNNESINEYADVSQESKEGEGSVTGYVVSTDAEQLDNYFVHEHGVPEKVIEDIRLQFDTVAVLRNIYVEEEYRSQGHGGDLLEDFMIEAAENGAEAVLLISDNGEMSQKFDLTDWYSSWGFYMKANPSSGPFMVFDFNENR